MKKLEKLKPGDTIGIVAPASSFDKDNFKRGVILLRKLGFKVKYEKAIFNKCWSTLGHDKQRAFQINRMFADKQVKAIFCAKAGSGSSAIIPYLNKQIIQENPKIFVGYSDITVILLYLQWATNAIVFHGPVVSGEMFEGMHLHTINWLLRMIGDDITGAIIRHKNIQTIVEGVATGMLVGGNLSKIEESLNEEYALQDRDKVLFLEDVEETPESINDLLRALKEEKKFKNIKGILFGRMLNCYEKEKDIISQIKKWFKDEGYPVLFGFPSGHT
ncbi:MAG: LD-carboxypeptidase, partial [Candidatus Omnitrophica bacterium]|nr:LD-carboxypeptidase [Candidatus Omnitrophota bacterium]